MNRRLLVLCATMLCAAPPAWAAESLTDFEMVGRYVDLERAAETRLKTQGEPSTATLAPLCLAYSKLKRYEKLFACLDQLEKRVDAGDTVIVTDRGDISNSDGTPFANMLRAEALIETGEYLKATEEGKRALDRVQDRLGYGIWMPQTYRLSILGTVGLAYALAGDKTSANMYVKRLEDFSIPFIGSTMSRPLRDNGLAKIHMALGEFPKALEYTREDIAGFGLQMSNFFWGYSGNDTRETYLVLPRLLTRGKCLLETGNVAEARLALDAVLKHPRIADFGELHWIALFERGRIFEDEKNTQDAVRSYRKAVDVIEQQRASINTEASKIGFVGDKQAVYQRLVAALLTDGNAVTAFEYVERAKARALVDMLAGKQDFAVHTANAGEVRTLLARVNTAEAEGRAQDASAETTRHRSLAIQTRQRLQQQAPELSSLVSVSSVTVQEIQGKLPTDEVLVEYYAEGKELYAFVLSKAGLQGIKLDGEGLTVDVQHFRQALEDIRSARYQELAGKLYDRLVRPLEGSLTQRNLLIVAHGPLHYLPFNALHDGNGYLIERRSIRQLPSASVLKYLKGVKSQTAGTLLAFGNPDLGDPQLDLKYAQAEAMNVAKVLPNSKALVRREASESAFKRYSAGFRYLHIASHGTFHADSPLSSALLLAKDDTNDGTLTVGELYSMRLNADLVTLSACETGLGKIANGDDVVGLTRGFLYAGSRSIVASLWKVDDEATSYLMTRFYSALKGTSKREALRLAQIETRKKYPHPYYWAAFQLTGEAS